MIIGGATYVMGDDGAYGTRGRLWRPSSCSVLQRPKNNLLATEDLDEAVGEGAAFMYCRCKVVMD